MLFHLQFKHTHLQVEYKGNFHLRNIKDYNVYKLLFRKLHNSCQNNRTWACTIAPLPYELHYDIYIIALTLLLLAKTH